MKREVAFEAMKIYAPYQSAGYLHLKSQLEDNAFSYLEPDQYLAIARHVDKDKASRDEGRTAANRLQKRLKTWGLENHGHREAQTYLFDSPQDAAQGSGGHGTSARYDIEAIRAIIEPQETTTVQGRKGNQQTPWDKRQITRTKRSGTT